MIEDAAPGAAPMRALNSASSRRRMRPRAILQIPIAVTNPWISVFDQLRAPESHSLRLEARRHGLNQGKEGLRRLKP